MIKLYDYVLSGSCYKVRLLLSMLNLEYEKVAIDFYPGKAHKQPDFLAINPLGQLPVLEDDNLRLRDAQAILLYLAAKHDEHRVWLPQDPAAMGQVSMWLAFAGGEIMSASAARLHQMLNYQLDLETARNNAHAAFRVLDDHLVERGISGNRWLVTDAPTIADIACFPYVALSGDGGLTLDDYPAIRKWLDRVKALPGFIEMPGIFPLVKAS